jgi:hypothetical protein
MMDVRGKTCRMPGDIRNTYKILVGKPWSVTWKTGLTGNAILQWLT